MCVVLYVLLLLLVLVFAICFMIGLFDYCLSALFVLRVFVIVDVVCCCRCYHGFIIYIFVRCIVLCVFVGVAEVTCRCSCSGGGIILCLVCA